ncbi:MAG: FtsX-like permease family protein [Methyloprofundus sp.]|nr:FtsX-like permease family protein [Methyloprofundus sp.]
MNTLDRKVFRELWLIRGQVLAIAIVIAAGLSTVIMSYSTLESLQQTRERYYQEYGFADLFSSLKRAPLTLVQRITQIPGIADAEPRVLAPVRINLKNYHDPIQGQLVSIDKHNPDAMNKVYIREGRMPVKSQQIEVLISEAFAQPHQLHPGDTLQIIVNGRKQQLHIVGIALSPEFIYQIAPGTIIPDFSRYGIIWMEREALETAYDMQGAFNDLSIKLTLDADDKLIIEKLDDLLKPYGGLGVYDRNLQVSHHFLSEEFKQLDEMGSTFSFIFLGVSIFLLNMVVGRIIASQREIIASLKAFGFSNMAIAFHYSKLIILIVCIGIVLGVSAGLILGNNLAHLYMEYYRFPYLDYQLQVKVILYSTSTTLVAALLGTWFSIRKAVQLQPAEAMRPEVPQRYNVTFIERLGIKKYLAQPSRMVLRHFERHPVKALLSVFGTAFACGIMIVGTFFIDAMDYMVNTEFNLSQREDLTVTLINPTSYRALYELNNIPGVLRAEAYRTASVKMHAGSHSHRTAIQGFSSNNVLHRLLDTQNTAISIPDTGILLTEFLAQKLGVKIGDSISVEFLEGKRLTRQVHVAGVINQYIGLSGYMNIDALNDLMQEGRVISGAYLAIEEGAEYTAQSILKNLPQIAGVEEQKSMVESFYATVGDFMLTYIAFVSGLSIAIAFGVIYNNARITLAERSRELASLRVLGFTQAEVAYILLGELGLITFLSIPLGMLIGYWLSYGFIIGLQQDLFRIPFIIEPPTYAYAILVVICSALISGLIVRRKLNQLDLVSVLKIKE